MTTDLTFFTNEPDATLLEREANPLRAVGILRSTLPPSLLGRPQGAAAADAQPVEVILSEYVAVQQGGE
jgi:hypothetical protein